jgi:hypothetical protein
MALGLTSVPEAEWLEIDDRYGDQMALRRRLLADRRGEVLASTAGSAAAERELLDTLGTHLTTWFPDWFSRVGDVLHNRLDGRRWTIAGDGEAPLAIVGQLVQEDFCLLAQEADGLRLIAAVLCFPSRWRLGDKIGQLLAPIHGPVPGYQERLARPVDRFLSQLRQTRLAARLNWSVIDDPALFQPTGHGRVDGASDITVANAGERLVLRVERQSFRRLPHSGAIVFGIRIHVTKLAAVVAAGPDEAARLAGAVRALPPEMARYKSLAPFRAALLGYLDARNAAKF